MGHLTVPRVPAMKGISACRILTNAIVKEPGTGRILFLTALGNRRACFPVKKDGSISMHASRQVEPEETVEPVHPDDLGVAEIAGDRLIFKES